MHFCLPQNQQREQMFTFILLGIIWNFKLLVGINQASNEIEYLAYLIIVLNKFI